VESIVTLKFNELSHFKMLCVKFKVSAGKKPNWNKYELSSFSSIFFPWPYSIHIFIEKIFRFFPDYF